MIKLKHILQEIQETFDDAAFHGNGMTPQEMRTGTCSTTWHTPDQDTGCPKFEFRGGRISDEVLQLALQYLNSEDINTLIAFSAGGPLLMVALSAGAKRPKQINFVAPAWKKTWAKGRTINPQDSAGPGFIVHGVDDIAVPIAHSAELSIKTGMPLYIFKDRHHITILKHKLSPAGGFHLTGKDLTRALQELPDWGVDRWEANPEELKQQQDWFKALM